MKKQLINKIEVKPFIKRYSGIVFEFSVIRRDHPAFDNWVLSEMTQLVCDERHTVDILKYNYNKIKLLDTIELKNEMIDSGEAFHEYFSKYLTDGYSAVIGSDRCNNLVYGYSYERKSYIMLGFDESGNLCDNEIIEEELYKAYISGLNGIPVYFIKQKLCDYKIDWWKLSYDLKSYHSGSSGDDFFSRDKIYGLNVMRRVIQILEKIKNEEIEINFRPLSIIYDHKRLLEYKFDFLLKNGFEFKYTNIGEILKRNKAEAEYCKKLFVKYNNQRNPEYIETIQEKLNKIIRMEDIILPVIIEEIDKYKRNLINNIE